MEDKNRRIGLTKEEDDVLDLGTVIENLETDQFLPQFSIAGTLVRDKHWNRNAVIEVMKKAWNPKGELTACEWTGNILLFRFEKKEDRDRVLSLQPWHFEGALFAIQASDDTEQPSSISFICAPFWVRIYDVPLACLNETVAKSLAIKIGSLENNELPKDFQHGEFLRMKVNINIRKPLLRGITVRIKGKVLWLPLKYEALSTYCYCCGMIGHQFRNCGEYDRNERPDIADMNYGPSLKASPLRRLKNPNETSTGSRTTARNLFPSPAEETPADSSEENSITAIKEIHQISSILVDVEYEELIKNNEKEVTLSLQALRITPPP